MEKQKNFLEDLSAEVPESFKEEVFVSVNKNFKPFIYLGALAFGLLLLILSLRIISGTVLPDMTGWQLEEIQNWVSEHHSNAIVKGSYSINHAINTFISANQSAGKKIKKETPLTIQYALGGDPNEVIELIDLKSNTVQQIKTWASDNQLTGIHIKYESSTVVPKDTVINYEIVDGTEDTFIRKNRITIYASEGSESTGETIVMPDFSGKTKGDILQWSEEKQVKVVLDEVYNPYINYGYVIKQSIQKETKITKETVIAITLSLGASIKVPDFSELTRAEATDLATLLGLKIFFRHQISAQPIDTIIGQDLSPNTEINQTQIVTLYTAQETDWINVPDFSLLTSNEASNLANLHGIKIFIKNKGGNNDKSTVITQSVAAGKSIQQDTIVMLTTSSTSAVSMPDFKGLSKNEATVLSQNAGITVVFNEVRTTNAPNNSIIHQSILPGASLDTQKTLLLDLAINSGVIAEDLTKLSKADALNWASENGITLHLIDQYSDIFPTGTLYNQSLLHQLVPIIGSIHVYHSLGKVGIDSFVGKSKLELLNWLTDINSKGATITLTFYDDSSTTFSRGTITNQSIKSDLIKINEKIVVWVSSSDNTGVKIPDLSNMDEAEFKLWCNSQGVPYSISDSYSDTYKAGKIIRHDYANSYLPKGEFLRAYLSLGQVTVDDFTNQSKTAVQTWQNQVNGNNANIKLIFEEVTSDTVDAGKIISQSIKNSSVTINETIKIVVSSGPSSSD